MYKIVFQQWLTDKNEALPQGLEPVYFDPWAYLRDSGKERADLKEFRTRSAARKYILAKHRGADVHGVNAIFCVVPSGLGGAELNLAVLDAEGVAR